MRVLVACEFSGIVRDVRDILADGWDLMVGHPPCQYLAVSGARWFKDRPEQMADALGFVRLLMDAPIPRIAIENPVSVISSRIRKPDQIVQPWMDWVIHPGATLREWREENHLPASAAAVACARMPLALYRGVEAGTEPITETVAAGLAHGTGIPATLWLNFERIFRAGLAEGKTWTP